MNEIKCPRDLNQFLLGEPIFENTFLDEECEEKKFYGDCYHCFSTAIASRDRQLKNSMKPHSWYYNKENPNSSWMICGNCMVSLDRNTDWNFCPYCGDPKDKEDQNERLSRDKKRV